MLYFPAYVLILIINPVLFKYQRLYRVCLNFNQHLELPKRLQQKLDIIFLSIMSTERYCHRRNNVEGWSAAVVLTQIENQKEKRVWTGSVHA